MLLRSVAIQLQRQGPFTEAAGTADPIGSVLGWLRIGIAVTDADRRMLDANAQAADTLAQGAHLKLQGGYVAGANRGTARTFNALLDARVAQPGEPGVALLCGAGGALEVLAVAHAGHAGVPVFVLLLNPTRLSLTASISVLRLLYRLTAAEAQLAVCVARGHTVAEAAAQIGIGVATARTHLHHALRKTGTRRQAQLTALVSSSLAGRLRWDDAGLHQMIESRELTTTADVQRASAANQDLADVARSML